LIGIQASGKTTFFKERFFNTHVRISLDLLRTRHRQEVLLHACLATQQRFVVDNTNPAVAERQPLIKAAREARFRVIGYYFQSKVSECIERNAVRTDGRRIPDEGILGTSARMELPSLREGFDELYYVRINEGGFEVEPWKS
jgi:predicted kinase